MRMTRMPDFAVEYDQDAHAAYLRFSDALVLVTDEVSQSVLIDRDTNGDIVGIEILDVQKDPR
jgi:uncharacterized protein YuzE